MVLEKEIIETGKKNEPGETDIEVIVSKHLARGLGLSLTFLGENREIGAPLDPTFLIPRALAMPHQHHPLRGFDRRERSRGVEQRSRSSLFLGFRRRLGDLLEA